MQIYPNSKFTTQNHEHKSAMPQIFLFLAHLGLKITFVWLSISLGMFNDDLGEKKDKKEEEKDFKIQIFKKS